jgi:hypothetical protein
VSDEEFAAWLRSVPREIPADEVERRVRVIDITRGEYFNHNESVHHYGEAAH